MLASDGSTLYGTWFTDDAVEVVDYATAALLPEVPLEGFDGLLFGLEIHDETRHVVTEDEVLAFEPQTGAALGAHDIGDLAGLDCVAP